MRYNRLGTTGLFVSELCLGAMTFGRVRYVGVSNWAAWHIMKALGIAECLNLTRFESLQAYYAVAGRDLERELVPMLSSEGLGIMVWSPLAGGLLPGKYRRDDEKSGGRRRASCQWRRSRFEMLKQPVRNGAET